MKRLGERIKRKRESLHMQLNDLAKKVGISSSALSQIENAKASPSITTLKSIADNLHVTVGEIIGEHETFLKNPKVSKSEMLFVKENNEGAKLFLLSNHDPIKQMDTYMISLDQNATTNGFMVEHPGQEFCFVNKGSVKMLLNNTEYLLNEGDSFYMNSNVSHEITNVFDGVSEVIWIVTPPNS